MKDKNSIIWLKSKIVGERGNIVLLILLNVLSASVATVLALLIKYVIDYAITGSIAAVIKGIVILGLVIILSTAVRFVDGFLEQKIIAKLDKKIKSEVFKELLLKDYCSVSSLHTEDIMTRLTSDVAVISKNITGIIPHSVNMLTRLIFSATVLFILDYRFALLFVGFGILIFIAIRLFKSKLKKSHTDVQVTEGKYRSFMQEMLADILEIKVFGVEDKTCDKSEKLLSENYKAKMRRKNYSVLSSTAFGFVFNFGYAFAIAWGAYCIYKGDMNYGSFAAILQLVNQIQVPFASLGSVVSEYYSTVASADRIIYLLQLKKDEFVKREKFDFNQICFKDVTFSYDVDNVLEKADFTAEKGKFTVITGESGSGKSTAIKLLFGVYSNYQGKISFITPTGEIPCDASCRNMFGYVPQGNTLISGTVMDNLLFAADSVSEEDVKKAADISGVSDFIYGLPDGFDTRIGENGYGISEGQAQRIAIARALLSNADVLVLDEATSALDSKSESKVLEGIKNASGKTVIAITHRPAVLKLADKHYNLDNKTFNLI